MVRIVQTTDLLLARTEEVGDCLIWTGCLQNGSPYVSHGGKMMPVRRLLAEFSGRKHRQGDFYGTTCGCPECVAPGHIVGRTASQHAKVMATSPNRKEQARILKVTQTIRQQRGKITMDIAREIRASTEPNTEIMARYDLSRSLVSRIRLHNGWKETMFQGLGAR